MMTHWSLDLHIFYTNCSEINTSYLTDSYIGFTLKMESVSKNFWPKNDGEKWSRKKYFEIPPCAKIVIFITEFVILGTFMK